MVELRTIIDKRSLGGNVWYRTVGEHIEITTQEIAVYNATWTTPSRRRYPISNAYPKPYGSNLSFVISLKRATHCWASTDNLSS